MAADLPPWPPLPGDERVMRAPAVTSDGAAAPWWPLVVMCAVFDVPVLALLVVEGTARDWLIGVAVMALCSSCFVLLGWGYRRRLVRIRGWRVAVRPGFGLFREADLRWVVRARLQRHGDGLHCRLSLIRVKGHPRSIAVPLQPPEVREALLSRLALVPGVAARGRLRKELESRR